MRKRKDLLAANQIDKRWLQTKPDCLKQREYDILCDFFGVGGYEVLSTPEIKKKYELSVHRITIIKARAIRKLVNEQERLKLESDIVRILLLVYSDVDSEFNQFLVKAAERSKPLFDELFELFNPEDILVKDLGLSTRSYNALTRNNLFNLKQVYEYEQKYGLISLLNIGDRAYQEILYKIKLSK